jgi:hypothetical protein
LGDDKCSFGSDSIDFEELLKELLLVDTIKGKVDDSFFIVVHMGIEEKIPFFIFTGIKNLNASGIIPQNEGGSVFFYRPVKEVEHCGVVK